LLTRKVGLELFYLHDLDSLPKDDGWNENFKAFRAQYLKEFLSEKKDEFQKINNGLGDKINDLFSELHHEYKRQVRILV